jgi:hypothetical protein
MVTVPACPLAHALVPAISDGVKHRSTDRVRDACKGGNKRSTSMFSKGSVSSFKRPASQRGVINTTCAKHPPPEIHSVGK